MSDHRAILPAARPAAADNEAVGPSMLNLLFGQRFIACGHIDETALNLVMGRRGAFLAFGMAVDFNGESRGMYVSMTAADARAQAAQLLQFADALDQGKGKQ